MMNSVKDTLKLNYDDYYKFLTSLSIIIFILSSGLSYYLGSKQITNWFVSFWLIIFMIISIVFFSIGVLGWKRRQDNLDKLLYLEVSEKEINLKKLELELLNTKIDQKKSEDRLSEKGIVLNSIAGEIR
jgi:uncharacterized membrane protein YbhN (UPF0104 family)